MPSSAAHFVGVFLGVFATNRKPFQKFAVLFITLLLAFWGRFYGYHYWENKLNFGTFTGEIRIKVPEFDLISVDGKRISSTVLNKKITVLDFWQTSCGICFRQFPKFEQKRNSFKGNSKLNFISVNIPEISEAL